MGFSYVPIGTQETHPMDDQGNYVPKNNRVPNNNLDKDAFLKILMVQLSNQDPLEPMKDTDFIAQMAQFTALEQAQQSNETAMADRAQSMIGKEIVGNAVMGSNGNNVAANISGKVEGYVKIGSKHYVSVDGYLVPLENVQAVFDKLPEFPEDGEGDGTDKPGEGEGTEKPDQGLPGEGEKPVVPPDGNTIPDDAKKYNR